MGTAPHPLIGVTADTSAAGPHRVHQADEKYLTSVITGTNGTPVIIPSLTMPGADVLSYIDGLLVTGSYSNIEPWRYGASSAGDDCRDAQRDESLLSLIPEAIRQGVPVLAICRGLQEMNVAYGGTLHQRLHEVGSFMEHREDKTAPLDVRYGLGHAIAIEPGGILSAIAGTNAQMVNTVHGQGIDRLGSGLQVEARAPDGLIEAISVTDSIQFALGVQWHPEYRLTENPFSILIYQAFAKACRLRQQQRLQR